MPYRLTERAADDVLEIFERGVREFGVAQAERYHAGLARCFDLLADQPRLCRLRREFSPPVRIHAHEAHVIIYMDRPDEILIVRVLHGRQDWRYHL